MAAQPGPRQRLSALRKAVAADGPPDGYDPTGVPGSPLPNPLPAGLPIASLQHINVTQGQQGRAYGVQQQGDMPANATPPLDVPISIVEICTFFPTWFTIPDVIVRATANKWTRKEIAKLQLHVSGQLDATELLKAGNRVQKQISDGGNLYLGHDKDAGWSGKDKLPATRPQTDATANMWELRGAYTGTGSNTWAHVPLSLIYSAIPLNEWPQGRDRQLLTRCLDFARENPLLQFDTSHWHLIIHHNQWTIPTDGAYDASIEDEQARDRMNARIADP